MTIALVIAAFFFLLPMVISMGGYYLRWKLLASAAGIAALPAYFGSGSVIAAVALWLLSCAFAVKSLAYTRADARIDRIIRANQPRQLSEAPATFISAWASRAAGWAGLLIGLASATAILVIAARGP